MKWTITKEWNVSMLLRMETRKTNETRLHSVEHPTAASG